MSKKLPKFDDESDNASRKRKTRSADYYKARFRKIVCN